MLHTPPGTALDSAVVDPIHTFVVPVTGGRPTVTVRVVKQPAATKYVIVAVPLATPVTTPELFTVATPVLLLLHVPPLTECDKLVVEPIHKLEVPEMPASTSTDTTTVVYAEPHPLVTV